MELVAEEFYRLRDDRTNRLTEHRGYQQFRVRLVADAMTVMSFAGQVQLLIAANLLARWCRQIEFGFPDADLVPALRLGSGRTLHERIMKEVNAADPFGQFGYTVRRSSEAQYALKVGATADESVDFTIGGDGWIARAGMGDLAFADPIDTCNPVGLAFAACLGVADAFKVATQVSDHLRVRQVTLSLFDFGLNQAAGRTNDPAFPARIDLGNIDIVGLGSVGSAVVYLLRMLPVVGSVNLIDHDLVGLENLNRSPLFGVGDVDRAKVSVAADYLQDAIAARAYSMQYDAFIAQDGRMHRKVDLLLPLANEFGVRPLIEHNYPPLQIYGTTTTSWGINYHRHIPLIEDCSACRFPVSPNEAPALVCSTGDVEITPGKRVDAALPFLSVGAAILTVADLIKLQLPGYPQTVNFAFIDFLGPLMLLDMHQRHPVQPCMCSGRNAAIQRRVLTGARFAALSLDTSAAR